MQILADDNAAVRRDMRELDERLHERDLAVAALSRERDEAADRIRELETEVKRFRERERHFADALSVADGGQYRNDWDAAIRRVLKDRDEAYDSGVRDGIERVRDRAYDTNVYDEQISTEEACWRALAAYNKEVESE
jgi:hypothetical protein